MNAKVTATMALTCALTLAAPILARSGGVGRADDPVGAKRGEPASKSGKIEAQRGRWKRLRAEYLRIASSLMEPGESDGLARADDLTGSQIQTRMAEAASRNAKVEREIAEIAVAEYLDGTAKQELAGAKAEIDASESAIKRAEGRLGRARTARREIAGALAAKGDTLTAPDLAARLFAEGVFEDEGLQVARWKFALEQAKVKQTILTEFSQKQRTLKLKSEVERKRAEELARESEWELAKQLEARAKRADSGADRRPEEKRGLALLAEAVGPTASGPPWDRGAAEIQSFLDRVEAKLAEARVCEDHVKDERETERFKKLTARILRQQKSPIPD